MDFFSISNFIDTIFLFYEMEYSSIISYSLSGIVFAVIFIFQAMGLYVIAKREGYKNRWLACIPFLSTYYIGVCAQKNKSFNTIDTRIISAVTAVLDVALVAMQIIYILAFDKLNASGCVFIDGTEGFIQYYSLSNVPPELAWAGWFVTYSDYIVYPCTLLLLVAQIMLYTAFFRTYYSRRYVLFTTFAVIFPVLGILIYAVKNNRAVNYREFLYGEQERRYRAYQQYNRNYQDFYNNPYNQNPYNNPYGQNNQQHGDPYGNDFNNNKSGGGGSNNSPDDPFSDF